ncbi:hypothetical protein PN419_15335 [Halorubrum ezzemoulense]|uniref:Uncharacterized protein n=1 Tax=Halorubrum ezzemoulense TaxID=337243 RepID=A0A256JBF0_HALEZ|nr:MULTISPECIES: hypothetical protein [Halorubrum]MDB2223874.1 hypothetical protein [Halorubrum ezzemoulense]MDB2236343.1 hypothetical protein [Halorubrum ezzemoulense]MDB2241299.1 hypothetical protein [Halorubrum ezzemoulense]MDB2245002.1 hypothetical protein [Halorubrum ezzemoulense]MDB2248369.1 hypothetical protein [Halorubrum ezzemoulense]
MRPLAVAGVLAVAVGILAALDRGVASVLSPTSAVVTLIGVLGVVQGIRYANARRDRRRMPTDTGEPERRAPAAVPGADLDERIARVASPAPGGYRNRRALRDRVREVAVDAVARDRNCSREAAATAVDDGTWTDDAAAAAFFDTRTAYPVRVRLSAGVRGRSNYWYGLRAAIGEIERIEGGAA